MLFSSFAFLVFFAVYLTLHFVVPLRFRLTLLLLGSTFFYGYWKPMYVWLPFTLIALTYSLVLWMERAADPVSRKRRLTLAVALLLLPLLFFKYTNFIVGILAAPLGYAPRRILDLSLPLGISFVTFTLIAYVVDSFRGVFPVEHGWSRLAGSVLFFPHLIAGPIVRPRQLIPQLGNPRPARGGRFALGAALFVWGLTKKMVFADPLAAVVETVFADHGALSGWHYLLGIYGFSVQIYCDFSGYSDMAVGIAYILGMRLPFNFDQPYRAISIIDFWRRWHITLSTWLRDYLYIPLGGNRGGKWRHHRNLMITMVLGGLWHGANVTFLIWGFIHGAALAINHIFRGKVSLPRWAGQVLTFHIVTFGWIFFRAQDVRSAWHVIRRPFMASWQGLEGFASQNIFAIVVLAAFFILHSFDSPAWIRWITRRTPKPLLWSILAAGLLLSVVLGSGSSAEFIYFEF